MIIRLPKCSLSYSVPWLCTDAHTYVPFLFVRVPVQPFAFFAPKTTIILFAFGLLFVLCVYVFSRLVVVTLFALTCWSWKSCTQDICMAPFRENSLLKRSEWHVLTKDRTVLPATHTFIHEWNEPSCLHSPAAAHHTALWPVLISRLTKGRKLNWPWWLVIHRDGMPARRRSPS